MQEIKVYNWRKLVSFNHILKVARGKCVKLSAFFNRSAEYCMNPDHSLHPPLKERFFFPLEAHSPLLLNNHSKHFFFFYFSESTAAIKNRLLSSLEPCPFPFLAFLHFRNNTWIQHGCVCFAIPQFVLKNAGTGDTMNGCREISIWKPTMYKNDLN